MRITSLTLISILLVGCTQVRYVPTTTELPPPPPRVYGEPLTDEEYESLPASIREKFKAGIKAHRDREEILEALVCSTRQKPCP